PRRPRPAPALRTGGGRRTARHRRPARPPHRQPVRRRGAARGDRPRAALAARDPAVRRAALGAGRSPPRGADPLAAAGTRRGAPADALHQPPRGRGAAPGLGHPQARLRPGSTTYASGPAGGSHSNSTGTRTQPSTGWPSLMAGLKRHLRAASMEAASNTPAGTDSSTTTSLTLPSAPTRTRSTTFPLVFVSRAAAG